ncbi:MAG TPA: LamG-like jellyroll fold domain-containing protein, partial [Bacteroidales bacterium]|nr:LamG-like jellyroll fold domain-containing protein [Bacteroidales bacterium]
PGNYYVFCTVTDTDGLFSTDSLEIMVREFSQAPGGSLIARYRLDGNARDAGVNQLDGITGGGITWGFDASGKPGGAACLEGSSAHILLPHSPLFNSTQAMSLTFVMKINSFYDREQYVVSHGSWQNRFKVSLSTKKIRFTVNTTNGVFDLDSEIIPETGQWYHVAVVFDGQDAELWINGYLDNFTMHSGSIRQTTIQPVIGLHLPANNEYRFSGCIFNVSFYDYALSPKEIMQDMESGTPDVNNNQRPSDLLVFPNPLKGEKLFFKTDWINGSDMTFTIVNIYGEVVQKGRPQQIGDGQYYISIDKYLSNGVYVLCLRDQNFQKKGVFMLLLQ